MKQLIFITITACIVMLSACSVPEKHDGYTFKGKIEGLNDGAILFLSFFDDSKRLDSCVIKNGEFKIQGKVKHPVFALCYFKVPEERDLGGIFNFWLENSEISMNTNLEGIKNNPRVSGSKESDIFYTYQDRIKGVDPLNDNAKLVEEQLKIVDEYKESYVALNFAKSISGRKNYSSLNEHFKTYYKQLSPEMQNSITGKVLHDNVMVSKIEVGGDYADFEAVQANGEPFRLSDIKTDYILLDFSGIRCSPCKAFLNHIKPHYAAIKDKMTLVVVYNENQESFDKYVAKNNFEWTVVNETSKIASSRYDVNSAPEFVLIDKNRKVIKIQKGYKYKSKPVDPFIPELLEMLNINKFE